MKRAILNELSKLSESQKGFVAALHYRYLNLCIKAEEASLLPVQVVVENEVKNLEDVAYAGKKDDDDYSLYVAPKFMDDLTPLSEAVLRSHPEFQQTIIKEKVDLGGDDGEQEISYLKFTMPEVDDDRYDVLKQGVDTFYDKCKVEMMAAKTEAEAKFAILGTDEKPEDMDELKKSADEIDKMWTEKRDELHDEKLQEIEDAHNLWLAGKKEEKDKQQETEAAHNIDAARSFKLNQDE
jgi:hypothetical protein